MIAITGFINSEMCQLHLDIKSMLLCSDTCGSADRWILYMLFITAAAPLHYYLDLWCIFDDGLDWCSFLCRHKHSLLLIFKRTSMNTSLHMASLYVCTWCILIHVYLLPLNDPSGMLAIFCLYGTVGPHPCTYAWVCVCVFWGVGVGGCLTHLFIMPSIINNNGF